jgi:hypothetical protein
MSRGKVWLVLVVVLVVAAVGGALWLGGWLDSKDARAEAERILSEAIGRPVHIEAVEVEPFNAFVQLKGVRVDNLEEWGSEPLMTAATVTLNLELDDLLDRHLDGDLRAEGVALRVAKRGHETNLDGMGRPTEDREPIDLDMQILIYDGDVDVTDLDRDETLRLAHVRVESSLSNRSDSRASVMEMDAGPISLHGVEIDELELRVLADDAAVRIDRIRGRIGEIGGLTGAGELDLDSSTWSFALQVTNIELDEEIVPVVEVVYPPVIAAAQSEQELPRGRVSGRVELRGQGLHWYVVRPTLAGEGEIRIQELHIPDSSLLAMVAHVVGAPSGPLTLDEAGAKFSLAQGWIDLKSVTVGRKEVRSPVRGRVGLDGRLDLLVDLMPVVRLFGEDAHAAIAHYTTSIPVRVRGTTAEPSIEPPTGKDVAKGLLGGALKRAAGQ